MPRIGLYRTSTGELYCYVQILTLPPRKAEDVVCHQAEAISLEEARRIAECLLRKQAHGEIGVYTWYLD
jgi:hypothetical protein